MTRLVLGLVGLQFGKLNGWLWDPTVGTAECKSDDLSIFMKNDTHSARFESIYCQHFHCSSKQFANHILWKCFAWPFPLSLMGRVFSVLLPGVLKPDYIAIDHIARTTDMSEFLSELEDFQYLRYRDGVMFRRNFRFCLSISKLKRIGQVVFSE